MVYIVNSCRGALTATRGSLHGENIDLFRVMEPARVNQSEEPQNTAVNAQLYLLNEMIVLKITRTDTSRKASDFRTLLRTAAAAEEEIFLL